jgi:serine protease Do
MAQNNLGVMYDKGEGVAEDNAQAVSWFRKAIEQGDSTAQCSLGEMYEKGEGVAEDKAQAVNLCRKAAEEGNEDAIALFRRLGEALPEATDNTSLASSIPGSIENASPQSGQSLSRPEVQRGYLGVRLQPIDEDLAASLGLPNRRGELVQFVEGKGPGGRAGLKTGDIITKINGNEVTPEQTVSYLVANLPPGTTVSVEVLRDGRRLSVNVTLGKRPTEEELQQQAQTFASEAEEPMAPKTSIITIEQSLGIEVMTMTASIARTLGVPAETEGVVIAAVGSDTDAARKGLRRGDIILSANYQSVTSDEALLAKISAAKGEKREAILLRIQRGTQPPAFIAVRIN